MKVKLFLELSPFQQIKSLFRYKLITTIIEIINYLEILGKDWVV
jgi:hypothetical protein